MRVARHLVAVLLASAVAGCSPTAAPEPEVLVPSPPPPPPVADPGSIRPNASGGLVRGSDDAPTPPPPPKPGEIVIPKSGGTWPWNLTPAPAPRPFRPATLADVNGEVTGLAVRPAADRAVVTVDVPWKKLGDPRSTRVLWCDTAAGTVLAEWEVKDVWTPLDVNPDGTRMLVRRTEPDETKHALGVWTVASDNELKRKTWQPHNTPLVGSDGVLMTGSGGYNIDRTRDVVWAGWVGADRIVSSSAPGQFRVFDAATLKRLGTIDATPGRPAVTPDGTKVAFLVANGVALYDPAAASVVGTRRTGKPPSSAALAFSPSGNTLAIGGPDRVTFLDLIKGGVWDTFYPKSSSGPPVSESFAWAGDRHLISDPYLYDLATPIPVWEYGWASRSRTHGRQTWVAVRAFGKDATLRPFEFPHPGVAAQVAALAAKPGLFELKPGDGVRIDVAGIPAGKQSEVKATLTRRLAEIGYKPDPAGTAVAVALIDPPTVTHTGYQGFKPVAYDRTPARLKLVKGGKVLWELVLCPSYTFG